jgi:hypothetical protein
MLKTEEERDQKMESTVWSFGNGVCLLGEGLGGEKEGEPTCYKSTKLKIRIFA